MANNIVKIFVGANQEAVSPGQSIIKGEALQFDTVTERWYFGSGRIPEGYQPGGVFKPRGNNAAGNLEGTWVCMGYSDVEVLPGGPIIATITWRGLYKATGNTIVVETTSIRETTYESITGIPGAPAGSQGRLHDVVYGALCRGIFSSEQKPPEISPTGISTNAALGFTLPAKRPQITVLTNATTYNYPNGWLPFSWTQEEPVPGFFLVTAEFKLVHEKTFG